MKVTPVIALLSALAATAYAAPGPEADAQVEAESAGPSATFWAKTQKRAPKQVIPVDGRCHNFDFDDFPESWTIKDAKCSLWDKDNCRGNPFPRQATGSNNDVAPPNSNADSVKCFRA